MNKIYLLTEHDEQYLTLLKHCQLPDLVITNDKSEANILLGSPPLVASHLADFQSLQWLQSTYAGVEALMAAELKKDYQLTNVKGIFGQLISEYVIGYCIQYFRHFQLYQTQQTARCWQAHQYSSLLGKKMAILGTGSIGNTLAKTSQAMGFEVIGINRTGIPPKDSAFDNLFHINEASSALSDSDIFVSTLPNTPHTFGLLNKAFFSCCQHILFFNVGRGSTLDETSLLECINNQYIQHAFLDVFEHEPLPDDHPFWQHESITITPHIAASSFPEQVIDTFRQNYDRWRHGFSLDNLVSFDKGY
ncbi:D-2-hydroxyacid dehydrogenase [Vibrio sp. S4M6]|uniref:D-2-hydroxyacid dehydrogenase n=1 Tax=Vibrio sinus TaxID=2946865 RepID=UPI002029F3EE|nr:D-2-hydroxyacid dehydrogenase [Vibrio sinus]MCL9783495.1 D-2-hydroxyacid dehydrogenase [Vibrio sinus]